MSAPGPEVSVVVPTRNRARRLTALLASLRDQTLPRGGFEVVVVADGSTDATDEVLRRAHEDGALQLRVINRSESGGPAAARNAGWRSARAPVVAFTDDDCVPTPRWLEAGLEAFRGDAKLIVQGPTLPDPDEFEQFFDPFCHTIDNPRPSPWFETCNVFYPRALLDELGGFDAANFHAPVGEDGDLAWRAIEGGATSVWAPDALVHHAVLRVGALKKLRLAGRWADAITCVARYPELRRRHMWKRVFWSRNHELVLRTALALALPRRYLPLSLWLAAPYVEHLTKRRTGPLLVPYLVALDLVEMAVCLRAGSRHRILII